MIDKYGRKINYLRVSITDRCNLRCVYCMPAGGIKLFAPENILSYEEIFTIVSVGAKLGIKRARLTGGEPLVRKGLGNFVGRLRSIEDLEEITMTTNGLLLEKYTQDLKIAGLRRANVSLDTLDADKFKRITRGGDIAKTIQGIFIAQQVGLTPIKINVVLMKGVNDDEIESLARLTDNGYDVRFIELMPVLSVDWKSKFLTTDEARTRLEKIRPLVALETKFGGPSSYFRWGNVPGLIGFISALSHTFCEKCNRLRLTADGKLKLCLCSPEFLDLREIIRNNKNPDKLIADAFRRACLLKLGCHNLNNRRAVISAMARVGG